jgi:type I restriction enzyme, R subunit
VAQHNEVEFERELCEYLAANGWLYSENDEGYDRERALYPEDFFGWLQDTQAAQLTKVVSRLADARTSTTELAQSAEGQQLLDRLVKVLDAPMSSGGGTLNVLRNGLKHLAASVAFC